MSFNGRPKSKIAISENFTRSRCRSLDLISNQDLFITKQESTAKQIRKKKACVNHACLLCLTTILDSSADFMAPKKTYKTMYK